MLRSSLCDYSDACILVKATKTVEPTTAAAPSNASKKIIFKNCTLFTNCISRINNTYVDEAQNTDVAMSMYNLK